MTSNIRLGNVSSRNVRLVEVSQVMLG